MCLWTWRKFIVTWFIIDVCTRHKVAAPLFLYWAAMAKWLRVWDTLPMFEATVCGRS